MNAQSNAAADGVNSPVVSMQAMTNATYLIAACARSTRASGQFCIWNVAEVSPLAQKDRHAV